jgi:hypothetical protein
MIAKDSSPGADSACQPSTTTSTHQAVQQIDPAARVLYADHDPTVAARAHALLTGTGTTSVVLADVRDPASLLAAVYLDGLMELAHPVGLLCTAVMEHIADSEDPWGCLARLVSALAPGSYLALSHLTGDQMPPTGMTAIIRAYRDATSQIHPRGLRAVTKFFDGLDLVPPHEGEAPELCKVGLWGAEDPALADDNSSRWRWAGVGRRPHVLSHARPQMETHAGGGSATR